MKTLDKLRAPFLLLLVFAMLPNCSTNTEPVDIPAANNGEISNLNITPNGHVTQTENGYIVDGSLTIGTETSGDIIFENANLDVEFDDNGTLVGVSGTSDIPPTNNYFEFENPVQADVGYFLGKFLNENRDFEIQLVEDRYYFVFHISVNIELKVGANDDPEAHKPLSIKAPVGGHITFIADYTDPMFFFSLGGDALGGNDGSGNNNGGNGNSGGSSNNGNSSHSKLGSVSFGASWESNFTFIPTNPVEGHVVSFEANQVTGGSVSFFKVLEASGMYYQNRGFDVNANFDEPMESNFGAHYRAGINGKLDFSFDIASFISFGFPIGSGSAAIVAEASTNNGVIAKAFINGLVEPDLTWWPDIIPVAPSGHMNAYGFVEQTGTFDIGLSGAFNLETPTGTKSIGGGMRVTPEAFTMEGQVTIDDETWEAHATFTTDETKMVAYPPGNFTDGISDTVTAQIDAAIATTEQAIADVEAANERYELELSLRGLRTALPGIIDRAQDEIDKAVSSAISSAESQANTIVSDNGAALCSTNITSQVNSVVKPYKDALNRLKNAVNDSNDNAQTRAELEAALRHLASLDKINKTVKVTITYGNKANILFSKCAAWSDSTTRNRTINATVLNSEQVAQLLEAADNVQYIAEAEGIKFDAQIILDNLPTIEDLENLKTGVQDCISELTDNLSGSGFVYDHDTKAFTPFIILNGEEKEVETFDIFNGDDMIKQARIETTSCNPDGALKKLIDDAKNK
ncbi:hypothetical protein [Seonamhaeicola sp.]|uniref:hypothetical protein n=1 Tax=Seonamhaeicola sp. TaxID=1912245 RepID=UPI00260FFC55|nr:hypothetical protein [Seonamhaeicola sp.]